jgi:hypothetical protein
VPDLANIANVFRRDFVEIADDCRRDLVDVEFGLAMDTVSIVCGAWSEGEPGRGVFQEITNTVLDPVPMVSDPPARLLADSGGKFEVGDRFVSKVSATYTLTELTGGELDDVAGEFYWLINGEQYRVVGEPTEAYLEWKLHLRRMTRTATY